MPNKISRISIPFYFVSAIFFIIGIYYLFDYVYNYLEILSYRNYVRIPRGAKIQNVTMDTINTNPLYGFPILHLIGRTFSRGLIHTILVQYSYTLDGQEYISRNYDLLNKGYTNKLDAILNYDIINNSEYVDLYIHPGRNRPYIVLNNLRDLDLPWTAIIYFAIGGFFLYGGYFLPGMFKKVPEKIYNSVSRKFGLSEVKVESGTEGIIVETPSIIEKNNEAKKET